MGDKTLRSRVIRLAHANPQHRAVLLPLLKEANTPDWDKLEDAYGDADASVTRCFMAIRRFIPMLKRLNLPGVDSLLPKYEEAQDGFRDAFGDLGDLFKAKAPNGARLAVFSEPDPRNLMKQFQKLRAEYEDLVRWSDNLQVGLKAIGSELPVMGPLRDLQEAQAALEMSIEALEPLVYVYLGRRTQPG